MQAHGDGRTHLLTLELSYNDVGHSPTGIMEAVGPTGVRTIGVLHAILPLSYPYRIFAVTLLWVCMNKHSRHDAVK